jgi:hypothetical protein
MHMKAWQAFWVGLYCRILHTLATGAVWSKKASAAWAIAHLDPAWAPLIARAQAVKEGEREDAMSPADPADIAATRAFARPEQHSAQIGAGIAVECCHAARLAVRSGIGRLDRSAPDAGGGAGHGLTEDNSVEIRKRAAGPH